jgi:hypothetical protein
MIHFQVVLDMYYDNFLDVASDKVDKSIKNLKEGLDPEILAYWFKRIEDKSIDIAPSHLKEKIHLEQDRILWMKFKIDISKRVVPYVMQVIEEYIPMMPYSTSLYFRKVQEILTYEMSKELC